MYWLSLVFDIWQKAEVFIKDSDQGSIFGNEIPCLNVACADPVKQNV